MTVFLRSALEAIPHLQQAKQCDPNSLFTGYFLAMINDIQARIASMRSTSSQAFARSGRHIGPPFPVLLVCLLLWQEH
jgi:hypothetical protein